MHTVTYGQLITLQDFCQAKSTKLVEMKRKFPLAFALLLLHLPYLIGVGVTLNYYPPAATLPQGFVPHPSFAISTQTLDPNSKSNLGVRCSILCSQNPECQMQTLDRETGECSLFSSGELVADPSGLPANMFVNLKVPGSEQQNQVQDNFGWQVLMVHQVGIFNYQNNLMM